MTKHRNPLFLLALLMTAVWAAPVHAQGEPPPLEHLEVALWPEYDQPAVLVIYRFQLSDDQPLPAQVALPIPSSVGSPFAVAWRDEAGDLFDAPYTRESEGDWNTILIELSEGRSGQLEYYDELEISGTGRVFRFVWPGTVELGGLSYEVQQPLNATDLELAPPATGQRSGALGLTHFVAELGPQPVGGSAVIDVSYEKSVPGLSLTTEQSLDLPSTADPTASIVPTWAIVGAGALVAGAGAAFLLRSRAQRPAPRPKRRRSPAGSTAEVVYCHNCGTQGSVSDKYCRECGTQLRRSRATSPQ